MPEQRIIDSLHKEGGTTESDNLFADGNFTNGSGMTEESGSNATNTIVPMKNPTGSGYGWHSYTISLRIRNWIWLFRCYPQLITDMRVKSLWHQLCWLNSHPEQANGGNHWLENLISISTDSIIEVRDQGSSVRKVNKNQITLALANIRKQEVNDLTDLVTAYRSRSAEPPERLMRVLLSFPLSLPSGNPPIC